MSAWTFRNAENIRNNVIQATLQAINCILYGTSDDPYGPVDLSDHDKIQRIMGVRTLMQTIFDEIHAEEQKNEST